MLVGVIAGPVGPGQENGLAAVLFYLLCYGVMNLGAFAVVASLRKPDGSEIDEVDDLRGLVKTHPMLAWILVLSSVSMLGLPPLLGFFGKLGLFVSGVAAGEIPLVIVLGLNSAIAAFYYLRLVTVPFLDTRSAREGAFDGRLTDVHSRPIAGLLSAGGVVLLAFPFILGTLVNGATEAVSGSVSGSWVGRAESGETLPSPAVDTTEHAEFDASTAVGLADDARP